MIDWLTSLYTMLAGRLHAVLKAYVGPLSVVDTCCRLLNQTTSVVQSRIMAMKLLVEKHRLLSRNCVTSNKSRQRSFRWFSTQSHTQSNYMPGWRKKAIRRPRQSSAFRLRRRSLAELLWDSNIQEYVNLFVACSEFVNNVNALWVLLDQTMTILRHLVNCESSI